VSEDPLSAVDGLNPFLSEFNHRLSPEIKKEACSIPPIFLIKLAGRVYPSRILFKDK
jgi:hypothetical protein